MIILAGRQPTIVALDSGSSVINQQSTTSLQADAERTARRYLEFRYTWNPANKAAQLAFANKFIAPQSLKAFEKTSFDLVTFSKGKNVAQRVYPISVVANPKVSRVEVMADRFTEIQGLKAATVLRVGLVYQTGPRTLENPWGIYIVKEEESQ